MTRIKLKYIQEYVDRHGKVRRYFRRAGYPKATLDGLPYSKEFMEAYQAALDGQELKAIPPGKSKERQDSISALIAAYYQSHGYKGLSASTKSTYRGILERFRFQHGDKPVKLLERNHIKRILASKSDTPAAANNLLRMLKMLMVFAMDEGYRKDDPTTGIKPVKGKRQGFNTWSEADIQKFESAHPVGSKARLAFDLLLYTGQRRSDVVRMGRQHVREGVMLITQQKTGSRVEIPIHQHLRETVETSETGDLTFLVTKFGKPFTPAGFTNWFRDMVNEAGLKDLSPHGLRKAVCRRLAEAGCTPHEIMSISGHKNLKEVTLYTEAANRKSLAIDAMKRVK